MLFGCCGACCMGCGACCNKLAQSNNNHLDDTSSNNMINGGNGDQDNRLLNLCSLMLVTSSMPLASQQLFGGAPALLEQTLSLLRKMGCCPKEPDPTFSSHSKSNFCYVHCYLVISPIIAFCQQMATVVPKSIFWTHLGTQTVHFWRKNSNILAPNIKRHS